MGSGERFYHDVSLRGPVPDRLLARLPEARSPDDDVARRLTEAAQAHAHDLFALEAPGFAYMHGFGWLADIAARGDARHVAGALFEAWLEDHGRYAPRAWAPALTARRTEAMLTHAPLLLEGRDGPMREQVFGTLIRQARHLGKSAKRAPQETRLAAAAGLMTASLCLPGASDQERAGKSALAGALAAIAGGQLPDAWRRVGEAQRAAASLLSLQSAFEERRLTPPDGLSDALSVLRLYLGALALPSSDSLAVLPGGERGDARLLGTLRLLRRPEGAGLLGRYGYAVLGEAGVRLHADLQGAGGGAFSLSDDAERVVTSAGVPNAGLRAVSGRMRDWAEALALPAASATLDARGFEVQKTAREDAAEGSVLTVLRQGPGGTHERRLFLRADGGALIGEDRAPGAGASYRFPLAPEAELRLVEGGAVCVLPSGRSWRFEAANAAVTAEDGVFAAGRAPVPARQVVVTAKNEGLRWAWRRA